MKCLKYTQKIFTLDEYEKRVRIQFEEIKIKIMEERDEFSN